MVPNDQDDLLKSENEFLRQSQLKLNKDIRNIERQIDNMDMDFSDTEESKKKSKASIRERFLAIEQKKKDLDFDIPLPKDHFKVYSNLKEHCNSIIDELRMQSSKVRSIIKNKNLEKATLESSVINTLKLQVPEKTHTRFQILKIILIEEKLTKLEKIGECFDAMLSSLEDALDKVMHEKDVLTDYDEMYYKSEFVTSKFNEMRLKSKYLFNNIFKHTLLESKTPEIQKCQNYQVLVDEKVVKYKNCD